VGAPSAALRGEEEKAEEAAAAVLWLNSSFCALVDAAFEKSLLGNELG